MNELNEIRELISQGKIELSLERIDRWISVHAGHQDQAYYLRGNAYRKLGNWQQALNSYQKAIDINPESPACEARKMVINILEFYNKDMFNQ